MATKSHRVQFKLANCSDAKVMARLRKMLCSSNLGWIGKCSRCEVPEQEKMRNSSLIRAIWPNHNSGCQPSHWLWSYVSLFAWLLSPLFLSVFPARLSQLLLGRLDGFASLVSSTTSLGGHHQAAPQNVTFFFFCSFPMQCPICQKRHNFAWSAP